MNKNKLKSFFKSPIFFAMVYVLIAFIIWSNLSGHSMRILNLSLLYAVAVMGLAIMLGFTGMLSFAGITFFGVGAYVVANLTTGIQRIKITAIPALLLAVLTAVILGIVIGLVILKLNGAFFTFSTIALVQISYTVFTNYAPLFGGPGGIPGIPPFSIFGYKVRGYGNWFILIAIVLALSLVIMHRIKKSRLGRSMASVRDDEIVAGSLGINVFRTKLIAFVLQAAFSGLSGALYAMQNTYVGSDMFTYIKSTNLVIMAMVGGVNSPVGLILGSIIVTALPEVLRSFGSYVRLAYGVVVILLMIFMPSGIAGLIPFLKEKISAAIKKRGGAKECKTR